MEGALYKLSQRSPDFTMVLCVYSVVRMKGLRATHGALKSSGKAAHKWRALQGFKVEGLQAVRQGDVGQAGFGRDELYVRFRIRFS